MIIKERHKNPCLSFKVKVYYINKDTTERNWAGGGEGN